MTRHLAETGWDRLMDTGNYIYFLLCPNYYDPYSMTNHKPILQLYILLVPT